MSDTEFRAACLAYGWAAGELDYNGELTLVFARQGNTSRAALPELHSGAIEVYVAPGSEDKGRAAVLAALAIVVAP